MAHVKEAVSHTRGRAACTRRSSQTRSAERVLETPLSSCSTCCTAGRVSTALHEGSPVFGFASKRGKFELETCWRDSRSRWP